MNWSKLGLVLVLLGVSTAGTAQPETAPPPREKLTTAELLVGRWKVVKYGDKALPKGSGVIEVFTKDGKYIGMSIVRGQPDGVVRGTYRVFGDTVEIRTAEPQFLRAVSQFRILKISKTELVKEHDPEDYFKYSNMVRDEGK